MCRPLFQLRVRRDVIREDLLRKNDMPLQLLAQPRRGAASPMRSCCTVTRALQSPPVRTQATLTAPVWKARGGNRRTPRHHRRTPSAGRNGAKEAQRIRVPDHAQQGIDQLRSTGERLVRRALTPQRPAKAMSWAKPPCRWESYFCRSRLWPAPARSFGGLSCSLCSALAQQSRPTSASRFFRIRLLV